MAGDLLYRQSLDVPAGPRENVAPIAAPVPDASGIGAAVASGAERLQAFATKQEEASQEAKASSARADALLALNDAQNEAVNSTDYEQAPKDFAAKRAAIESQALGEVNDPKQQALLRLHLTYAGISADGKVAAAALARQNDVSVTSLNKVTEDLMSKASRAGSAAERAALVEAAHQSIDAAAEAGHIDASTAFARKHLFDHGLSTADVARGMAQDPAATLRALDDPAKFPALTPFERETLKAQSIAAYDERTRLQADDLARRDPAMAAARYGTVTARGLADQVYARVIVPHESGGDPNAIGKAGEVGLGQIMPDTARAQAKKLGLNDVAGMDNATLTEALKNPELNTKLGGAEWRDSLERYGGNVWAAAAAYNKGATRADAWDAAARQKFGDHYSAAQFASVVDSPVAQKYVLDVAKRIGVDTTAAPLSFRGSYGVAAAVTQQLEHQANQQRTQLHALVALTDGDRDAMINAFKQGYATDPQAIAQAKQPLVDQAARGDTQAIVKLRQFEDAQATYPLVQEAYKHTPEQVEGAVAALRAKIEKDGGSAQELRRLEVLDKVSSVMNDARKNNPVGLIERQMGPSAVTSVSPPQSPQDPAFAAALSSRSVVAASANAAYGGEMKFFKPAEAAALKPWFAGLAPDAQAAAIGTIAANTSGPAREAAFREITDGKPVTMFAAGLAAKAPDIASSILQGVAGVDTYVPSKGAASATYTTEKAKVFSPAIFTAAGRLDEKGPYAAMNAAIDARYAYLSAQANDSSGNLNSSRLKQAADDVTGGVVYHNGTPTIAPARGMTQSAFDAVVYGLTDKDFSAAQTTSGSAITADYLRSSAKLRARSDGTYYLQLNQDDTSPKYAVDKTGASFVLDLRNRKAGAIPPPDALSAAALP